MAASADALLYCERTVDVTRRRGFPTTSAVARVTLCPMALNIEAKASARSCALRCSRARSLGPGVWKAIVSSVGSPSGGAPRLTIRRLSFQYYRVVHDPPYGMLSSGHGAPAIKRLYSTPTSPHPGRSSSISGHLQKVRGLGARFVRPPGFSLISVVQLAICTLIAP